MKKLRYYIIIPVLMAAIYLSGPQPDPGEVSPELPEINLSGEELHQYITQHESAVENLKLDNQARIIWADDSLKNKTTYSVVYLHGFSASQGEGIPVHVDFARRYGCNLYLARLYDHGIYEKDGLLEMVPDKLVQSAAEAVAIGEKLGEKVILMSTSTGGTLSLYMAATHPEIAALIMYSPNIKINNPAAPILAYPWGLQIGRLITGSNYVSYPYESYEDSLYWTNPYRLEAVVYLQELLNITMTPYTYKKVNQPVFLGYYYKNKEEQDQTVRVDAMLRMFDQLGTDPSLKVKKAFPDAGEHVIACRYKSGDWKGVQNETYQFAEDILKMNPRE